MNEDTVIINGETYVKQDSEAEKVAKVASQKYFLTNLAIASIFTVVASLILCSINVAFIILAFPIFIFSLLIGYCITMTLFHNRYPQASKWQAPIPSDNPYSVCSSNYLRFRND